MVKIIFETHDGVQKEVEGQSRSSLMQVAVDNGIEEIYAECGGACSCGTCHCYIDSAWAKSVPEPSSIELLMLDCVLDKRENSRLSCQVDISDEMDGMVVRLPATQY